MSSFMWEEHFEVALHCLYPGDKVRCFWISAQWSVQGGPDHRCFVYLFLMVDYSQWCGFWGTRTCMVWHPVHTLAWVNAQVASTVRPCGDYIHGGEGWETPGPLSPVHSMPEDDEFNEAITHCVSLQMKAIFLKFQQSAIRKRRRRLCISMAVKNVCSIFLLFLPISSRYTTEFSGFVWHQRCCCTWEAAGTKQKSENRHKHSSSKRSVEPENVCWSFNLTVIY